MQKTRNFLWLKILSVTLSIIVVFFLAINLLPPTKSIEVNPFINHGNAPMIAAHRGGSITNPENTMRAYKSAVNEYKVEILESDLYLTKDNKLVYSHDSTIDRTSDVALFDNSTDKHYISDYTLEELKNFNFGYNFKDENGDYPYRDITLIANLDRKNILKNFDLQIVEVSELFEQFYESNPDLLFIIEIKNNGEKGYIAANIIDDLLTTKFPKYKNRVVIGTFHDEIEKDLKENHPSLLTGASTGVAKQFIITQLLKVNIFDNNSFECLQIPMSYDLNGITFRLDKKDYIRRAHRRNIAVQYWTINDVDEMERLIDIGCDAIMTDNPKLLREVINSI